MTEYLESINDMKIGGNDFYGSVYMFHEHGEEQPALVTDGTVGSTSAVTISLEDYIPNDGFDYEVCLSGTGFVQSNGYYVSNKAYPGTVAYSDSVTGLSQTIVQRRARTAAHYYDGKTVWVPISGKDRNVTMLNSGSATCTYSLKLVGYRRIGNNRRYGEYIKQAAFDGPENVLKTELVWTEAVQDSNLGTNDWRALAYDGNKVVALGGYGYISTGTYVATHGLPFGGKAFDGQWTVFDTRVDLEAGKNLAAGEVNTYSLADIIPNDGYDYLVSFGGFGRSQSGSGYAVYMIMGGTHNLEEVTNYGCRMMQTEYHSSSTSVCSGNLRIPIRANDRNVSWGQVNTDYPTDNSGLYVLGYRRIGKNE